MAVRSDEIVRRLVLIPASGAISVYTVPWDRTLIVKDIRPFVNTATALNLLNGEGPGLTPFGVLHTWPAASSGLQLPENPPWCVLREGAELVLRGAEDDSVFLYISGALLSGDPT